MSIKLTDDQVEQVRQSQDTQQAIATRFGVSRKLVRIIKSGTHRLKRRKTVAERFWEKVGPVQPNGCRLWLGAKVRAGYGRFYYKVDDRPAHVVAALLSGRTQPEGMDGLHSCDTPACVEESHIFWGTTKDNTQDAISKGRHVTQNPEVWEKKSKLNRQQTIDIFTSCTSTGELAAQYNVNTTTISGIRLRKRKTHSTKSLPDPVYPNRSCRLTAEEVIAIRHEAGPLTQIGAKYGVSSSVVSEIKRGKAHTHVKELIAHA